MREKEAGKKKHSRVCGRMEEVCCGLGKSKLDFKETTL